MSLGGYILLTVRQPRYRKEEFSRRGDEIYDSQVRSQVEEGNHGKIMAIDIETGASALQAWAQVSTRPLVIFIDEIDALQDLALISITQKCVLPRNCSAFGVDGVSASGD